MTEIIHNKHKPKMYKQKINKLGLTHFPDILNINVDIADGVRLSITSMIDWREIDF